MEVARSIGALEVAVYTVNGPGDVALPSNVEITR